MFLSNWKYLKDFFMRDFFQYYPVHSMSWNGGSFGWFGRKELDQHRNPEWNLIMAGNNWLRNEKEICPIAERCDLQFFSRLHCSFSMVRSFSNFNARLAFLEKWCLCYHKYAQLGLEDGVISNLQIQEKKTGRRGKVWEYLHHHRYITYLWKTKRGLNNNDLAESDWLVLLLTNDMEGFFFSQQCIMMHTTNEIH